MFGNSWNVFNLQQRVEDNRPLRSHVPFPGSFSPTVRRQCLTLWASGSKSVVPDQQHQHCLGMHWKGKHSILSQKLWGWGPAICVLINPPRNSIASWNLRTTTLVK